MHHKRKRSTVRAEGKRIEAHAFRQAEARATEGLRAPQRIPIDTWGYRPDALPIGDLPSNGKVRSKRKTPKKEKCPVNGTHEWYREWTEESGEDREGKRGYHTCPDCKYERRPARYRGYEFMVWGYTYCDRHIYVRRYVIKTRIETCIHCWTVKQSRGHRVYDDAGSQFSWRGQKTLKKRPVRF